MKHYSKYSIIILSMTSLQLFCMEASLEKILSSPRDNQIHEKIKTVWRTRLLIENYINKEKLIMSPQGI